jgi:hypothetical protein
MLELVRGDKSNLKGRAPLYVLNEMREKPSSGIRYPVLLIGQNISDMVLPGEYSGTRDEIRKEEEKLKETIKKGDKNSPWIISRPFAVENPSDLLEIPGDILYIGIVPHFPVAYQVLDTISLIYATEYHKQLSRQISNNDKNKKVPEGILFDEKGLVLRLYHLTGELYGAREQNDLKKEIDVREGLLQISIGKKYARQIEGLVDAFSKGEENGKEIIGLQIRLAGCIQAENYEEAKEIKKKLDFLMKK